MKCKILRLGSIVMLSPYIFPFPKLLDFAINIKCNNEILTIFNYSTTYNIIWKNTQEDTGKELQESLQISAFLE